MKNQIVALIALAVASASFIWSVVHRPPKVGYAETAILMSEFIESVEAKKDFEAEQKKWDSNLKILNDSLMSTMEKMKVDYNKSSAATKDSLRSVLQRRNEDLQRYANAVKKMSIDKEKELMDPVLKKMNSFLEKWGKENGFDIILGATTGGNILQANSSHNVTASILKDLNIHYAAPKKAMVGSSEKTSGSKVTSSSSQDSLAPVISKRN